MTVPLTEKEVAEWQREAEYAGVGEDGDEESRRIVRLIADLRAARAALTGFVKWAESKDGPLKDEWEESYIGEFENTAWTWEETLERIQTTDEDVWTDPSIKDSGLVALYRKARAALPPEEP